MKKSKIGWLSNIVLILGGISFLSLAMADAISRPTGDCINVKFRGWRILGRIDKGTYEIITQEEVQGNCRVVHTAIGTMDSCSPTFPAQRAVLVTNGDKFESDGIIHSDLWIEILKDDKIETAKIPTKNGFSKEYPIYRESASCALYGPQIETEEKAKRKEKAKKQKAIEDAEAKAEEAKEKAARMTEESRRLDAQKKVKAQKEKELQEQKSRDEAREKADRPRQTCISECDAKFQTNKEKLPCLQECNRKYLGI